MGQFWLFVCSTATFFVGLFFLSTLPKSLDAVSNIVGELHPALLIFMASGSMLFGAICAIIAKTARGNMKYEFERSKEKVSDLKEELASLKKSKDAITKRLSVAEMKRDEYEMKMYAYESRIDRMMREVTKLGVDTAPFGPSDSNDDETDSEIEDREDREAEQEEEDAEWEDYPVIKERFEKVEETIEKVKTTAASNHSEIMAELKERTNAMAELDAKISNIMVAVATLGNIMNQGDNE